MMQHKLTRSVLLASTIRKTTPCHKLFPSLRHNSSRVARPRRIVHPAALVAGSILSGFLGYSLARYTESSSNIAPAPDGFAQKYGTREDFKKAIEEMRNIFSAEAVSTDPEVLGPYGYSENDYHSGTRLSKMYTPITKRFTSVQHRIMMSLYILNLRKTFPLF
jgi:hypothetical protein